MLVSLTKCELLEEKYPAIYLLTPASRTVPDT